MEGIEGAGEVEWRHQGLTVAHFAGFRTDFDLGNRGDAVVGGRRKQVTARRRRRVKDASKSDRLGAAPSAEQVTAYPEGCQQRVRGPLAELGKLLDAPARRRRPRRRAPAEAPSASTTGPGMSAVWNRFLVGTQISDPVRIQRTQFLQHGRDRGRCNSRHGTSS